MTARYYERDEVEERGLDIAEDAYLRHRIGAHGEGQQPWPAWSMSNTEQPPFRSHLAAAMWAEDRYELTDEDGH